MSLNEMLRDLVYECGALGALVMADDGTTIDEFRNDDLFDLQGCSVNFVPLFSLSRRAMAPLESGEIEEIAVLTENLRVIIRTLTDGLALFLVQPADGNYGKARYLMRRDRHSIIEVLR